MAVKKAFASTVWSISQSQNRCGKIIQDAVSREALLRRLAVQSSERTTVCKFILESADRKSAENCFTRKCA